MRGTEEHGSGVKVNKTLFDYGMHLHDEKFWETIDGLDLWYYPPEWKRFMGDHYDTLVEEGWYVDWLPWQMDHLCPTIMLWGTEHAYCEPCGLLGGPDVYYRGGEPL
jgi:hypothetical protein